MTDGHVQNASMTKVERKNLMEMISQTWNLMAKVFFYIYDVVLIK